MTNKRARMRQIRSGEAGKSRESSQIAGSPESLIVELDGWGTHGTKQAFEDDRDQDSEILAATGIPTVRITQVGLRRRPLKQVARINAILARRSQKTAGLLDTR